MVTIDAMGTQIKIAEQMIEQQGEYALALKDHQGNLYEEGKATFAMAEKEAWAPMRAESDRPVEKDHGRLEIRTYWTISAPEILKYLDPEKRWKGLRGIGMVKAERRIGQEVSQETRYFLLSFPSEKNVLLRSTKPLGNRKQSALGA
jgi:predicted transposase YbfD/YdcC